MKDRIIQITKTDYNILKDMVSAKKGNLTEYNRTKLDNELQSAKVMEPHELPPDIIQMNSHIELRDLTNEKKIKAQIVPPSNADMRKNKISYLAPISVALIGYRQGDIVEWEMPNGIKRYEVLSVNNQGDAA